MSAEGWAIIVVGIGIIWVLGSALDRLNQKLDKLIHIVHRIRINDRERDF